MGVFKDISRGLGLTKKPRRRRKAKAAHAKTTHKKRLPPRRKDGSFKKRGT